MDREGDHWSEGKSRIAIPEIDSKKNMVEGDRKAAAFMNSPGGKNGKHVRNGKYEQE